MKVNINKIEKQILKKEDTKSIQLYLKLKQYFLLNDLSKIMNTNRTDVIRVAIDTLWILANAQREGKKIIIKDKSWTKRIITLPGMGQWKNG